MATVCLPFAYLPASRHHWLDALIFNENNYYIVTTILVGDKLGRQRRQL